MTTPIAIRRAGVEDAAKLSLLAGAAFLESFAHDHPGDDLVAYVAATHSIAAWRGLLDGRAATWIAEAPLGAPVGYAVLAAPDPDYAEARGGDLELKRIYLLVPWQGQGRGQALFDAVIPEARARGATRLLLAVYEANHRARAFYARRGFHPIGVAKFPVGSVMFDDILMALDL